MTTVFLIIADRVPVLAFATLNEAKQFCSRRPDLTYHEFKLPDGGGEEDIKRSLRDFFSLKQRLNNGVVTDDLTEEVIERRLPIHQKYVEWLRTVAEKGSGPVAFDTPGQCQRSACPGRAYEAMLSLS
jgi:hypothetical protein